MVVTVGGNGAPVRLTNVCHQFECHGQPLPVLDAIGLGVDPANSSRCWVRAGAASPPCFA